MHQQHEQEDAGHRWIEGVAEVGVGRAGVDQEAEDEAGECDWEFKGSSRPSIVFSTKSNVHLSANCDSHQILFSSAFGMELDLTSLRYKSIVGIT